MVVLTSRSRALSCKELVPAAQGGIELRRLMQLWECKSTLEAILDQRRGLPLFEKFLALDLPFTVSLSL